MGPNPKEIEAVDLHDRTIDIEDDDAVRKLSGRYQLSPQAATIRLGRFGRHR
jgi:hypothetical protein